jgi:hypothetical protein
LLLAAGDDGVEDVLLIATGEDGEWVLPQLPQEADGDEEILATPADVEGVAFEFPSQLPQEEDSDVPFPLPRDEPSVAAAVVCQLPQLPESPCLSRFSTTPAKTELAKASKTNELFTMVAS